MEVFKEFHSELLEKYTEVLDGPGHVLGRMKGYWSFFYLSFRNGKKLYKKIKKAKNMDHFLDLLNRFFDDEAEWLG